jgi:hypothetical protein
MSNESPFRSKIYQKADEIFGSSSLPLRDQLMLIRKCVMAQCQKFTQHQIQLNNTIQERGSVQIESKLMELRGKLAKKKEDLGIAKCLNMDDNWLTGVDL